MAFAADLSRGGPTGAAELEALRRRRAHDGAYGLALVAGCLVGIGISWQAVLSEGARERLVAGWLGVTEDGGAAPQSPTLATAHPAMWPSTALKSPAAPAVVAEIGDGSSAALPERLLLDEGEVPAAVMPGPLATTEIVFAMNSSFLVPGDYTELRRLVAALPERGRLRVAVAATVSDEPVKNGGAVEAERYNRWLAERRADRVAEWLRRQIGERAAIATDLLPHDPSRRVTVGVRPAP